MIAAAGFADFAAQTERDFAIIALTVLLIANLAFFCAALLVWWAFQDAGRLRMSIKGMFGLVTALSVPISILAWCWPSIVAFAGTVFDK